MRTKAAAFHAIFEFGPRGDPIGAIEMFLHLFYHFRRDDFRDGGATALDETPQNVLFAPFFSIVWLTKVRETVPGKPNRMRHFMDGRADLGRASSTA